MRAARTRESQVPAWTDINGRAKISVLGKSKCRLTITFMYPIWQLAVMCSAGTQQYPATTFWQCSGVTTGLQARFLPDRLFWAAPQALRFGWRTPPMRATNQASCNGQSRQAEHAP